MAEYTPINFYKDGRVEVSENWQEHYQLLWEGWTPGAPAPKPPAFSARQRDELSATIETGVESHRSDASVACVVPTYDDDPRVTHPSVLHVPTLWNGYPYWMAFTPYPTDPRENPSIVASHDGINWEVPAGLTNPIVDQQFAIDEHGEPNAYNSDTELLLVDGALWLYWRTAGSSIIVEKIWRSTSTDGVTWTTPVQVLEVSGGASTANIVSPCVVELEDGTFAMWTVESLTTDSFVDRRTSADGLTWSSATRCTVPEVFEAGSDSGIWHMDVKRVGSRLFMLGNTNFGRILYWWSDDDGLTWEGSPSPVLPLLNGMQWYRGSWVPRPGHVGHPRWDLWVPDRSDSPLSRKIHHFKDVDLYAGDPGVQPVRGIYLPAAMFDANTGTPAKSTQINWWRGWDLDAASAESLLATTFIPASWGAVRARVMWATESTDAAGSTGVRWTVTIVQTSGSVNPSTYIQSLARTTPTPGQRILTESVMPSSSRTGWVGGATGIRVERSATHAGDTMTGDAHFLGLLLEPAS